MKWQPIFEYLPVEQVVRERQKDCYSALSCSDQSADRTCFVEFMFHSILQAILA